MVLFLKYLILFSNRESRKFRIENRDFFRIEDQERSRLKTSQQATIRAHIIDFVEICVSFVVCGQKLTHNDIPFSSCSELMCATIFKNNAFYDLDRKTGKREVGLYQTLTALVKLSIFRKHPQKNKNAS